MEELDLNTNNLCTTEDAFEQFQSGAMYEEDEFITLSDIVSSPNANQDVNEILHDDPCDEVVSLSIQDEKTVNNINIPPFEQNKILDVNPQTKNKNNKDKTRTSKRRGRKKKGSIENSDVQQTECEIYLNKPTKRKRQSKKNIIASDTSDLKYIEECAIEEPKSGVPVTGKVIKPANKTKRKSRNSLSQKEIEEKVIKKQGKKTKQTTKKLQKESLNESENKIITSTVEDNNISTTTPHSDNKKIKHKRGRKKQNISCQDPILDDTEVPTKLCEVKSLFPSKKINNELENAIPRMPLYDETKSDSQVENKQNIPKKKSLRNSVVSKSVKNDISEEDIEDLPLSNLSRKTENELHNNDDTSTLENKNIQCTALENKNFPNSNINSTKKNTSNCKEITVKKRGRPKKILDNSLVKTDLEATKLTTEIVEKSENINDLSIQEKQNKLDNSEIIPEPVISSTNEPQIPDSCEKINISTESNSQSKRNSRKKIIPDFEYNVDSVVKNDKTEDIPKSPEDHENLDTEDSSGRRVRRRVLKNWNYDEGSDEDPYANVELSDDEPRRRKKGGRCYSDDEYFPGDKRQMIESESDMAMDEDDLDLDNRPQKKKKSRKSDLAISNKSPRKKSRKSDAESICTTEKTNTNTDSGDVDFEDCLESSVMRGSDDHVTPTKSKRDNQQWGVTKEFDNFIAKIVQGTDIKISKKSVDNVKTSLQIPIIEATEAKKNIEKSAQTITVNTKSAGIQTDTAYEIPMKDQVPLTGEQSEKACDFLSSIVQTTAELGQLMTQKSEDFITKKINTKYVTDTFKMDYCVKKSFLLFKLAKHNLVQMEEDLSKQYEDFLRENNLIQHRQEPKIMASTSKASDSDCEIVEEPVKKKIPTKIQKPAFNPKTVFLNKELSIKIARKPTEEPAPKKKLDIKGRNSVWINDSVVVKKVKPNQSFLAQDSRNKKPPDHKITLEKVNNFFKMYERQKALFICAPFIETEWFGKERQYMCNYFVDSTIDFPEKTVVMQNENVASEVAFVEHDSNHVIGKPKPTETVELCPETLFLLCTKIVQSCLHPRQLVSDKISNQYDFNECEEVKTHSQNRTNDIVEETHFVISDINKNIICLKPNHNASIYVQPLKTLCFKRVTELISNAYFNGGKLKLTSDKINTCVAFYKNDTNNEEKEEANKNTSNIKQIKPLLPLFSLCVKVIQKTQKAHWPRNINNVKYMAKSLKSIALYNVQIIMNGNIVTNNTSREHKCYNVKTLLQLCLDAPNISQYDNSISNNTSLEQNCYNVKSLFQLCVDATNITANENTVTNDVSLEQKPYNVDSLKQRCIDAVNISAYENSVTNNAGLEHNPYNAETLKQMCVDATNISAHGNTVTNNAGLKQNPYNVETIKQMCVDPTNISTFGNTVTNNAGLEQNPYNVETPKQMCVDPTNISTFGNTVTNNAGLEQNPYNVETLKQMCVNAINISTFGNTVTNNAGLEQNPYNVETLKQMCVDAINNPTRGNSISNNTSLEQNCYNVKSLLHLCTDAPNISTNANSITNNTSLKQKCYNGKSLHQLRLDAPNISHENSVTNNTNLEQKYYNSKTLLQLSTDASNISLYFNKINNVVEGPLLDYKNPEVLTLKSICRNKISELSTEWYKRQCLLDGIKSEKTTLDFTINNVNTVSDDIFLDFASDKDLDDVDNDNYVESADNEEEQHDYSDADCGTSYGDLGENDNNWVSQVQMQELRSCLDTTRDIELEDKISGINDSNGEDSIVQIKLEPNEYHPESVDSSNIKIEPGDDHEYMEESNNYSSINIITKQENIVETEVRKEPITRQSSNSYDEQFFESFVSSNKMIVNLDDYGTNSHEIFSQSSQRVRRQYEPDSKDEIDILTDTMNLLVPQNVDCKDRHVESSDEEDDEEYNKSGKKKAEKRKCKSKKNIKDLSNKGKILQKNEITALTKKNKDKISHEHDKSESSGSESDCLKLSLKIDEVKSTDNKSDNDTKRKEEEEKVIQCNDVDSTELITENKCSLGLQNYKNDKESDEDNSESVTDERSFSPLINSNEPVEILKCEPALPIFDKLFKKENQEKKYKNKTPPKDTSNTTLSVDRNGWKCYPIDRKDTKIYSHAHIQLDKLPESFLKTYFQYQDKTKQTIDNIEVDKLTNLQTLQTTRSKVINNSNKSKPKKTIVPDFSEAIEPNEKQLKKENVDEFSPFEDDSTSKIDKHIPPTPSQNSKNYFANKILMNDESVNKSNKSKPKIIEEKTIVPDISEATESNEKQLKKENVDEFSPSEDESTSNIDKHIPPTPAQISENHFTEKLLMNDESVNNLNKSERKIKEEITKVPVTSEAIKSNEKQLKKENVDEFSTFEDDSTSNVDKHIPPISVQSSENHSSKKIPMNDESDTEKANVEAGSTVIKVEKIVEQTYTTRSGRIVKCKVEQPELENDDLMLTADKMMNKELALLHAPVDLKAEEDDAKVSLNKSHKNAQKNASKGQTTRYRIRTEDDSSSEEEKQWFTTKEKLLKRLLKKNQDTNVDDAKRAKIVSEFIEKRGELPERRGPSRTRRRCSKKNIMERRKQIKILSRELFGVDNVHSKKYSPASTSKGRRNIRKVIDKKSLARSTVVANMEEFERKRRLTILQAQLREDLGCEEGVNVVVINDELCLEYDFEEKRPVVSVHPFFTKVMKAHQYEGVKFMWDACFESVSLTAGGSAGGGCILAHCMGLGKTLQVLALLHTVLTHPQVGMSRVLVCCPLSTVLNWVDEIHKWIGPVTKDIKVFELSKLKKTYERAYQLEDWYNGGGIFIIGYELFRSLSTLDPVLDCVRPTIVNKIRTALLDPGPDIIVCDEGHLLKNDCSVLAVAMSRVVTKRRIVLTGTPMQNNLREYYCMVNFVKPNLLGSYSEYSNRFENPIMNGQHRDSREEDIKLMKARTHILHKVLEGCLQRQEASVLYPYLPKKYEYTVFISLTKCQWELYKHYLTHYINTKENKQSVLRDFHVLQKIWTHPLVLNNFLTKTRDDEKEPKMKAEKLDDELEEAEQAFPSYAAWWAGSDHTHMLHQLESSYKFLVAFQLLHECVALGDKVLIFSTSLYAMDALEFFLNRENKWTLGREYYRLDGSVPPEVRQKWCREFNAPHNTSTKLFLISTRAGSLGLNMTAANRVIILDTSWNPAHDIQSIFRVYRFGQKKDCYIYRLVAMGTMEQKIYERSVTKQAVSCRVVDEQQIDRHYNLAELSELYRLDEEGSGISAGLAAGVRDTALLRVAAAGDLQGSGGLHAVHEHDSLLRGSSETVLPEHERNAAWVQFQQEHATTHIRNFEISVPEQSVEVTDQIKIEPKKESETSTDDTTPNKIKKHKRKSKNKNIQLEPQPSTSQQDVSSNMEETIIMKIMNILIKHNFHKTKSPNEISALIKNVRDAVKAPEQNVDDVDPMTASIARVLLEGENITFPEVTTKPTDNDTDMLEIDFRERKRRRNRIDSDEEYLPDTRKRKSTSKTYARKSNESVYSDINCDAVDSGAENTVISSREVLHEAPVIIRLKKSESLSENPAESYCIANIEEKTFKENNMKIKINRTYVKKEKQRSNNFDTEEQELLNESNESIKIISSEEMLEKESVINLKESETLSTKPPGSKHTVKIDEKTCKQSKKKVKSAKELIKKEKQRSNNYKTIENEPLSESTETICSDEALEKDSVVISLKKTETLSTKQSESKNLAKIVERTHKQRNRKGKSAKDFEEKEKQRSNSCEPVDNKPLRESTETISSDEELETETVVTSLKKSETSNEKPILNIDKRTFNQNKNNKFAKKDVKKEKQQSNICITLERETLKESTETINTKEMLEKEPVVISLNKSETLSKKLPESNNVVEIDEETCKQSDKKIITAIKDIPKEKKTRDVPERIEDESSNECIEIDDNCDTDNVSEEPPVQPTENESICLSDDDEPIIPEPAPLNKKEKKQEENIKKDDDLIPLHKSVLTNKNFIKLVAHTYLSGNPMLDEDAALLAAQYSTLKALKEVQATGKNLTSGPIYDIALKVLGRVLMKKLFAVNPNKHKAETMLLETENLQNRTMNDMLLENSKLQKPVLSEDNKKTEPETKTIHKRKLGIQRKANLATEDKQQSSQPTTNSQETTSSEATTTKVVPVGMCFQGPALSTQQLSLEECILPDDDEVIITTPIPLPAAGAQLARRNSKQLIVNTVSSKESTGRESRKSYVEELVPTASVSVAPQSIDQSKTNKINPSKASSPSTIENASPNQNIAKVQNVSKSDVTPVENIKKNITPVTDVTICLDSDEEDDIPSFVCAKNLNKPSDSHTLVVSPIVKNNGKESSEKNENKNVLVPVTSLNTSSSSTPTDTTKTRTASAPKITETKCKPGDIIRINESGRVEILKRITGAELAAQSQLTKLKNDSKSENNVKKLNPPTGTNTPKDKLANVSDKANILKEDKRKEILSTSKQQKDPDPLSVIKNVVHIPAFNYERNTTPKSQVERTLQTQSPSGKEVTVNTKLSNPKLEVKPVITYKNTQQVIINNDIQTIVKKKNIPTKPITTKTNEVQKPQRDASREVVIDLTEPQHVQVKKASVPARASEVNVVTGSLKNTGTSKTGSAASDLKQSTMITIGRSSKVSPKPSTPSISVPSTSDSKRSSPAIASTSVSKRFSPAVPSTSDSKRSSPAVPSTSDSKRSSPAIASTSVSKRFSPAVPSTSDSKRSSPAVPSTSDSKRSSPAVASTSVTKRFSPAVPSTSDPKRSSPAVPSTSDSKRASLAVASTSVSKRFSPAVPSTSDPKRSSPAVPCTSDSKRASPAVASTSVSKRFSPAVPSTSDPKRSSPAVPSTSDSKRSSPWSEGAQSKKLKTESKKKFTLSDFNLDDFDDIIELE